MELEQVSTDELFSQFRQTKAEIRRLRSVLTDILLELLQRGQISADELKWRLR